MNNIFILILLGFAIGVFGTLIGAGGGFVLVPVLLLTLKDTTPNIVTAISMAVVAVNAISGSVAYAIAGRIDYRAGLTFALFTIPGSIAGVFLVKFIPIKIFDVVFGCLLIVLSAYLLIRAWRHRTKEHHYTPSAKAKHHTLIDSRGHSYQYAYNQTHGILISVLVGFLSPLLGIGGGIIHVPAMVNMLHFPVYIATATSHFILAIMSTVSVIVHIYEGSYASHDVRMMVLGLCIGVVPGAQLGAWLSHRTKTHVIVTLLAVCLGLVGVRILLLR